MNQEKAHLICRRTPGRMVAVLGGGVLLIWALLPLLFNGIFGVGVVVPAAVALALMGWGLHRPKTPNQRPKGWKRIMLIAGMIVVILVGLMAVVITGLMVYSATSAPAENATVIVLGSKIYGDQPSRMMRNRLEVAAAYLRENPDANCVVAGGLGPGETYTEAYVMKKYLVEQQGIAPERIACEDRSTDTHENLQFSMEIIRQRGWNESVAVATQVFHQYRARQLAIMAGADSVGGVACLTPAHLTLNYWVRECAAICRLWLIGY